MRPPKAKGRCFDTPGAAGFGANFFGAGFGADFFETGRGAFGLRVSLGATGACEREGGRRDEAKEENV